MDGGQLGRKQERRQPLIWLPANHSVVGLGTAARLASGALLPSTARERFAYITSSGLCAHLLSSSS